ncbi:sterol desaturase family protein [Actinocorallia sp. API 0066]|uniref:sterol desaturase family protein n=1 Tax=Actinocorallia sp. API 0066 TaxID=2896846 RepID=UPI001E4A7598|nr:sterol desaturase family protein [Actinocorallia sp. API 0066]MCD0449789.1 sterol desaturase family protein [Actinocorallia sp. API 0066]
MFDLILYAIPFFVLFLVLEIASFRYLPDDDERGYDLRDTRTSLLMGLGNVVLNLGWKAVVLAVYAAAYTLTPLRMDPSHWWTWALLFLAEDLVYYWYHRTHHTVRVLWASHVVHHSSRYYNLSTALRQTWTPFTGLPYWLVLAFLGFEPWMILLAQSWSLLYQFFLHTERVGVLWRPVELVLNTPSHHRVHHASDREYLDRNYGGILIIWDRLFRTFAPERARPTYGLTKNITTHNPAKVATHEYADIWRDLRRARSWAQRAGHLLGRPGWSPAR